MQVTFHPSGTGINAQSIGVPAPECGPKGAPMIGATGEWECAGAGAGVSGGGNLGGLILMGMAAYFGWKWWKGRGRGHSHRQASIGQETQL